MTEYRPPIRDIQFVLNEIVDFDGLRATGAFPHAEPTVVNGALEEAGRFVAQVIAPLARNADLQGSHLAHGGVTTPDGYADAYRRLVEAGWPGVAFPEQWGGGAMPFVMGFAVSEMLTSADMAFSLCPALTFAANELLMLFGTPEQQALYLPKLVPGEWTGTMAMTEPQAGSDVGALTTKAVPADDGSYRITGNKIFVTWGEHDLAENIVHLVLARTPDTPPGTKGISCFIVPKFMPNADGGLGERNDITCVSLEHKLGIHASPTCVLSFGDAGGAVGYLIGEECHGLKAMFAMMNNARLLVGMEGLAIAERSFQQSLAYALQRRQGRTVGAPKTESSLIVEHPDVRRMLMLMKSQIEAMRGVMYKTAEAIDLSVHHPDADQRAAAGERASILIPICKAWGSDLGVTLTSLGMQIHGGVGYIEETGAAQWFRDARITPIYEGTNGIQALDLVARRLPMRNGAAVASLLAEMRGVAAELGRCEDLAPVGDQLGYAVDAVEEAALYLGGRLPEDPNDALAGSTPFLEMIGITTGGWTHGLSALTARRHLEGGDDEFYRAKLATARFYADHVLPTVAGLLGSTTAGANSIFAIDPEMMGP
jgi:alkylation response protein AidB-like acyl-CoA dehydrogenase